MIQSWRHALHIQNKMQQNPAHILCDILILVGLCGHRRYPAQYRWRWLHTYIIATILLQYLWVPPRRILWWITEASEYSTHYIPMIMHTVAPGFVLLWSCANRLYPISSVTVKQPRKICVNQWHECTIDCKHNHKKTKHIITVWIYVVYSILPLITLQSPWALAYWIW